MSTKQMNNVDSDKLDQEAADWFVALNSEGEMTEEQFDRFAAWIDCPEAEAKLSQTETVWELASVLEDDPQINAFREQMDTPTSGHWYDNVVNLSSFLKVACLCIVSVIAVNYYSDAPGVTTQNLVYQTTTGERKSVKLPDNTVVVLNTASEIHVSYGEQFRKVILERGEALFDVRKDLNRPFKVFAGAGEITALGTLFDVKLHSDATKHVDVALLEGKISVEKALPDLQSSTTRVSNTIPKKLLSAGERISFNDLHMSDIEPIADAEQVASWKQGHLYFTNSTLSEIVAEVNRYTVAKLVIDDPELENERMSAYFNLDDGNNESLLYALEVNLNVKWYKQSGTTVLYRDKKAENK